MNDIERLAATYEHDTPSEFITDAADLVPRIDWVAYFKEFCLQHGPLVQFGNRLIFADGWQYSAFNHEGPEYPPPEDPIQLNRLQQLYWNLRLRAARTLLLDQRRKVKALTEAQEHCSAPLQYTRVTKVKSRTTGQVKLRAVSGPINHEILALEIKRIETEVTNCETEIATLKSNLRKLGAMSCTQ